MASKFDRDRVARPTEYLAKRLARAAMMPTVEPSGDPVATLNRLIAEERAALAEYWKDRDPLTGRKNGNGAGSAADTPAPSKAPTAETSTQDQNTTNAAHRQVELVVVYETDQATARPRMGGGELVSLAVDGKPAEPPTRDLNTLYRLLQARGYTPAGFQWLGKAELGKRQRRQVYAKS